MRTVSDAAKITKVVTKVLDVLDKANLTEAEVISVMNATKETLGIENSEPEEKTEPMVEV